MTARALALGLALGLFISAFTFFNDAIISQSWFISNHLPISVFGVVAMLVLGLNPLLTWLGRLTSGGGNGATLTDRLPLSMGEIAVITAIGLAACGWPSFGFFWGFPSNTAAPAHWEQSNPAWQANHVMSYVPGASAELGAGHLRDPVRIASAVRAAQDEATDAITAQVWRQLQPHEREVVRRLADADGEGGGAVDARGAQQLTRALNRVIREGSLEPPSGADLPPELAEWLTAQDESGWSAAQRAWRNRRLLVWAFPQQVLEPPAGDGALVSGRDGAAEAVSTLIRGTGLADSTAERLANVPWATWWPTLRLWGGLGLLLSGASLCLALVVHPQWSKHELLTYPLAQFVSHLSRREDGRGLPTVAYQGLFWMGLGTAVALHTINGLGTWFTQLPTIPLGLEMGGLAELFPNARRVSVSRELFNPYLYLSAIAFAFFLHTRVSFSVGIATVVFTAMGGMLLGAGIAMPSDYLGATPMNLIRFGSYAGMAVMIAYVGRNYYRNLAAGMVGLSAGPSVPRYAVWAARLLVVCSAAAVWVLCSAGLDWVLSSIFVLLVLLMFLILSRIVAETGLFFVQTWWMPVAVMTAVFGVEELGPTSFILLAIASIMIVGDPRTVLMPYLSNGLQMVERAGGHTGHAGRVTGRVGWPMLAMLLVGFVVAGAATMSLIYERGNAVVGTWSAQTLPSLPFDRLATHLADMSARGTLLQATLNDGITGLSGLYLSPNALMWIGVGAALILLTALARLRLPWWPIHPVLFLVWGTMPASRLAVSFLLGWAIKFIVIRTGGARAYQKALPLMVGVIAGEVLIGLIWITVGALYYAKTGQPPPSYRIYP